MNWKNFISKRTAFIFFLSLFFVSYSCEYQALSQYINPLFKYKKVSGGSLLRLKNSDVLRVENEVTNEGINLQDFLNSKDSVTDYTDVIQNVISKYSSIIFPATTLTINAKGLNIPSNRKLLFLKGSKLVLKGTQLGDYAILKIWNVENVSIVKPYIIGDRAIHLGNNGEWGMGISVKGSTNISIYSPTIVSCWGDGIYIAGGTSKPYSENIKIANGFLDFNRRNGISIISAVNVIISNSVISNTFGVRPMIGLDIEPNSNLDELKRIRVENLTTLNNANSGISVYLEHLQGANKKYIDILIKNHTDVDSYNSFSVVKMKDKKSINGKITVEDPSWMNTSKQEFVIMPLGNKSPTVEIVNSKQLKGLSNIKEINTNSNHLIFTKLKKKFNMDANIIFKDNFSN